MEWDCAHFLEKAASTCFQRLVGHNFVDHVDKITTGKISRHQADCVEILSLETMVSNLKGAFYYLGP